MRRVLPCFVALALTGIARAQCTSEWTAPTAETMSVSTGIELRIARFANMETQLSVVRPEGPFSLLFTHSGPLLKGIADAERPAFMREAHWWILFGEPASAIVWRAIRVDPCKASGTYDIDVVPFKGGSSHTPDLKLLRARGQAVADGQGRIRYSFRFDTEPALPADKPLTYAGTLSFVKQGDALPGDIDVSGFNVMPRDGKPEFVAPPGTLLSQLRAQLGPRP